MPLAAAAIAVAIFIPVLGHGFVNWDDQEAIYQNPDFQPPTLEKLGRYWDRPTNTFYVPLTYTIWGLTAMTAQKPGEASGPIEFYALPFHLLNVLAHAIATAMAFLILRRLVRARWPALTGAVLFAIHPLQVEPVAWVSSMYTPLSGAFALVAAWQYLVYADERADVEPQPRGQNRGRPWLHFVFSSVAFVLALLTKPSVVALPVALAALDLVLNRRTWRVVAPLALWLVPSAAIIAVTRATFPGRELFVPPLWGRAVVALDAAAFYLWKLIVPFHLAPDYGRSPQWLMSHRTIWLTGLAPVALLLIGLLLRKRAAWLPGGLAFFFIAMLPTSGLMPFDYQQYSTVGDRYAYLSLLGIALIVAFALARWPKPLLWSIGGIALLALGVRCTWQQHYWRDTQTLFDHTLAINPASLAGNRTLGYLAAERGENDLALAYYQRALQTVPDDPSTHYNIGNLLARQKRFNDAEREYRIALRGWPDNLNIYNNLTLVLLGKGDWPGAAAACEQELRIDPNLSQPHVVLGNYAAQHGDFRSAWDHFQAAVAIDPNNRTAQAGLAQLRALLQSQRR